jgi:hypothetical protein
VPSWLPISRVELSADDPYWTEKRVFSRFEARLWIEAMTRYADCEYQGDPVPAGCVLLSIRDLADRFLWSKDKVRRFLAELRTLTSGTRIEPLNETRNGTLYRVISEGVPDLRGTPNGTPNGTPSATPPLLIEESKREEEIPSVSRGAKKPRTERKPKGEADPELADAIKRTGDLWISRFGGTAPWSRIGKVVRELGRAGVGYTELLTTWEGYLEVTPQYASPEAFAQKYRLYRDQAAAAGPMIDELGRLTAAGRAALNGGK